MRSRRWPTNVLLIFASGGLIILCGPVHYSLNPGSAYLVSVVAQIPLIASIAMYASTTSSTPLKDEVAARNLVHWRVYHLVAFTVLALLLFSLAATQLQPPREILLVSATQLGPVALSRNFLALSGAAMLSGSLFGSAFGWIIPLGWATLPYLAIPTSQVSDHQIMLLLMQGDGAFTSFVIAGCAWCVGVVVVSRNWS